MSNGHYALLGVCHRSCVRLLLAELVRLAKDSHANI